MDPTEIAGRLLGLNNMVLFGIAHGGLSSKAAVEYLYRIDSTIRESMRISDIGVTTLPLEVSKGHLTSATGSRSHKVCGWFSTRSQCISILTTMKTCVLMHSASRATLKCGCITFNYFNLPCVFKRG